jgi:glutamate-1-semialdehyde 2,1-aminomutase
MTAPTRPRSASLFARAQDVLPGGVSSPVRAFGAVGGTPLFIASASGSKITDVDGNEYVDLVMSWGPVIHGHAHPEIIKAIETAAHHGTTFGAPCEAELRLAEKVRACVSSIEMLRFVGSGTGATMSALRLARGYTGRDIVVKFDGCYHGHVDALLVQAGSGALTHGRPTSLGVPEHVVSSTRRLPYNDVAAVEELFSAEGDRIAAVIVEPVAGNMGTVPPAPGFLDALRRLCTAHGALLIFDEVITGFRVALGGAQALYGITPDLTCLGKIVGGGLPAAAFGGRREIMELLSPLGGVYQAGTLSGNPVAMAAGLSAVDVLAPEHYTRLSGAAVTLQRGLEASARAYGIDVAVNREQAMLSVFFTREPVKDLATAQRSDTVRYARFFHAMLDRGVYLPPSQFETWMLSLAHGERDLEKVLAAADGAFAELAA